MNQECPQNFLDYLSFFLIITYSLTFWFSTAIGNISLYSLSILYLYHILKNKNKILIEPKIQKLILVSVIYLFVNCIYSSTILNFQFYKQVNYSIRFIQIFLFIITGYYIYLHKEKINIFLLFSLIGILIGLILNQDWNGWNLFLKGIRSGSLKWSYWTMGLYSATGLFCILFIDITKFFKKRISYFIFKIIFIIAFFQFLIVSQNRSTWIATLICLILLLSITTIDFQNKLNKKRYIFFILTTLIISSIFVSINKKSIENRKIIILQKQQHLTVPGSFKERIIMTTFGIKKWLQHPLLGWGIGTNANKKLASPSDFIILENSHLHSNYIEMLVRTGIIGFSLFLYLNLYIFYGFIQQWKKGKVEDYLFLIILSVVILTTITSLSDFRLFHRDFRFYYIFFWGIMYAYLLDDRHKKSLFSS